MLGVEVLASRIFYADLRNVNSTDFGYSLEVLSADFYPHNNNATTADWTRESQTVIMGDREM